VQCLVDSLVDSLRCSLPVFRVDNLVRSLLVFPVRNRLVNRAVNHLVNPVEHLVDSPRGSRRCNQVDNLRLDQVDNLLRNHQDSPRGSQ
jgi:hypothetical protein